LELWLDAQDEDTLTGSPAVTAWEDKSGEGNDVTDSIASGPQQTTINGHNALFFDATDRLIRTVATGVTGLDGPDMTLFVVASKTFDGGSFWFGAIHRSNAGWTTGWRMFADPSTMGFSAAGYTTDQADISVTTTGAAFHIWAADHLGSSTVKNGYLNNEFVQTDTSGVITGSSANDLYVGNSNPTATYSLLGSIGEILCYNSVLSESDRLAVSEYLADKWSITLP